MVFSLRPQLMGCCFMLITLISLEHFRQGRSKMLWVLPGVFLLWVNTHGSFALGLFVLGLYWIAGLTSFRCGWLVAERWTAWQRRRLLLTILLCVLALLVPPYGARLPAYLIELGAQESFVRRIITEWQPMDFSSPYGLWFLVFLLVMLLWEVLFPVVYKAETLAFLLFTVFESSLHLRFLIFFAMAFTPALAAVLARWMPPYEPRKDRPVVNAVLAGLILSIVVAFIPSTKRIRTVLTEGYPVGAVAYLRQHPIPTGMFNEDIWGGFLVWTLGPDHRVFIDTRADIYQYSGVLADYVQIISLRGNPLLLLQRHGIKACLLHRNAPLGTLLAASPGWRRVYEDKISVIFMRPGSVGKPESPGEGKQKPSGPPRAAKIHQD
jgi:hypothetical protein